MRISILQKPEMKDAMNAWVLSRDPLAEYEIEKTASVDAPVMEMPSCILNFEGMTILEREIICSLRNHVVWARTSRVDNPMNFTVPEEFQVPDHLRYKEQMHDLNSLGRKQDEWRLLLPLIAHTAWTQRISLRDLARLAQYFGYLVSKAQWHILGARFAHVQFEIVRTITEMVGGRLAHAVLENSPVIKFLYEGILPSAGRGFVKKESYFKYVHLTCNIGLRAQIVRHRELQFIDHFWTTVNNDELPYMQLNHIVSMQLSARNDVWKAVLSKRACWIAQADLWQPIIKAFGNEPPLPCSDGKCPFYVDAEARLQPGKDPNPPCPVFCNLYKIPKEPHRSVMLAEAKKRGTFWEEQVVA